MGGASVGEVKETDRLADLPTDRLVLPKVGLAVSAKLPDMSVRSIFDIQPS